MPPLLAGLAASALGEALGYAIGAGRAPERVGAYEFHRDRFLVERDRAAMSAWVPAPVAAGGR